MHIQEYKPQETLTLFEPDYQKRPEDGFPWFILLFLSIFYIVPAIFSVPATFGTIWYAILFIMTWGVIQSSMPAQEWVRLTFSKEADCIWAWKAGSKEDSGSFSPQDVETFSFALSTYQGVSEEIGLVLDIFLRDTTSISGELRIDGIETRDEVIDFSKRVAQILNIPWGNIDANDPLNLRLSFGRAYTEETCRHPIDAFEESAPTLLKRKKAQDEPTEQTDQDAESLQQLYKKGEAKKDARLADIITTPWEPDKHRFVGNAIAYKPEKLLVFERKDSPLSLLISAAIIGFSSIVLSFIGLMAFEMSGKVLHIGSGWPIKIGFGVFCLCSIWYLALWKMGRYPPERWTFVFDEPSLSYEHGDEKIQFPLDKATGILFERTMTKHTRTTGTGSDRRTETYYTYNGITYITGMPGRTKLEVCETGEIKNGAQTAYDDGIAFAGMLSNTLALPLSFEDEA